jgi:hypothetical protein
MIETRNAVIESVRITNDDHGVLSAWVHLDYGGCVQGFGGYVLYVPKSFRHATTQKNYAGHFLYRTMEVVGVTEWTDLKGCACRVRADRGKVHAIGHVIRDQWFDPSAEFKEMEAIDATAGK